MGATESKASGAQQQRAAVAWDAVIVSAPASHCATYVSALQLLQRPSDGIPSPKIIAAPYRESDAQEWRERGLHDKLCGWGARGLFDALRLADAELGEEKRVLVLMFERPAHFWTAVASALPAVRDAALASSLALAMDSVAAALDGSGAPDANGAWFLPMSGMLLLEAPRLQLGKRTADASVLLLKPARASDGANVHRAALDPVSGTVDDLVLDAHADDSVSEAVAAQDRCGVVFMSTALCRAVHDFAAAASSEAASAVTSASGSDKGQHKMETLSLFGDVLTVLTRDCTRDAYLSESCASNLPPDARAALFEHLHGKFSLRADNQGRGLMAWPRSVAALRELQTSAPAAVREALAALGYGAAPAAVVDASVTVHDNARVTRSLLLGAGNVGEGAFVSNCRFGARWDVGAGAVCVGLRSLTRENLRVPAGTFLQEVALGARDTALVALGVHDEEDGDALNGRALPALLAACGLTPEELWPRAETPHTLREANLFPLRALAAEDLGPARAYLREVLLLAPAQREAPVPPAEQYAMRAAWRRATRVSLREIVHERSVARENEWARKLGCRADAFAAVSLLQRDSATQEDGEAVSRLLRSLADRGHRPVLRSLDALAAHDATTRAAAARTLRAIAEALPLLEPGPAAATSSLKSPRAERARQSSFSSVATAAAEERQERARGAFARVSASLLRAGKAAAEGADELEAALRGRAVREAAVAREEALEDCEGEHRASVGAVLAGLYEDAAEAMTHADG